MAASLLFKCGEKGKKAFKIDISKFEYCEEKEEHEVEGYTIYAYTPRLIVLEKVRAICQQTPEYTRVFGAKGKPRPRDFYDIYLLVKNLNLTFSQSDFEILKEVFRIKEVPINILHNIENYRDFHREGFQELEDTIIDKPELFDFYFDYVIKEVINKILN